jgi:hypothetical protein
MKPNIWACAVSVASLVASAPGCGDDETRASSDDAGSLQPGGDGGSGAPRNDAAVASDGAVVDIDGGWGGPSPTDGQVDGAGPVSSKAFSLRGKVGSAPGDKRQKAPGDAAVEHAVTHVMAVNPATANPVRYLTPIAADGTFTLGVDLNTPWVIVLVDSHQVGKAMNAGVLRSDAFDLDSIAATRAGMVDLGVLDVDETTGAASASVPTASLLSALGLSEQAATLLGEMDDVSLRYVNPDIDGNGKIDVQENVSYPLDFHLRYTMRSDGQDISFTALINRYADVATTEAQYGLGSAIAYWEPSRFGVTTASDFRIRFGAGSGTYWGMPGGSYVAGVWIDDDGAFYQSAGTNSVGITFDRTMPFPMGEYAFEVKGTQLTYTDVRTHSLDELNAGPNLIVPFLKLNVPDAACTGWSCPVQGFDYKWMRRAGSGVRWVPASPEQIALVVPQRGGFLGFAPGGDMTKRLEYTIPGMPAEGTVQFAAPGNRQGGVTDVEVAALTLADLCHVGISYDDTLGMRIFQGWKQNDQACLSAP